MSEIVWIMLIFISGLCAFSIGITAAYLVSRRGIGS